MGKLSARDTPDEWEPHKCGAIKPSGEPCKRWALRGGARCALHGGKSPAVMAKAHERIVAQVARTYGLPIETTPSEAFIQELARTNGHVTWLNERIAEMPEKDVIWGIIKRVGRSGIADEQNWDEEEIGAIAHIWLGLYFRERQHLMKIADAMIKNGLTEMQLRLNARAVEVFEGAMLGMLTDLRIDPSDPAVRTIISQRMIEASKAASQPIVVEKSVR